MKKLSFKIFMANAIVLGFLVSSCNSGTSTTDTSSTTTTDSTTTTTKPADTTTTSAAPAAPAGKVVKGTDITVHAVGDNMSVMHYDVSEMDVPANTKVKITLINDATDPSMQHNIVIVKPGDMDSVAMAGLRAGMANGFVPKGDNEVIAASKLSQPGKTVELSFTTPAAGTYAFMCTYPGHYQKMHGTFIVQ